MLKVLVSRQFICVLGNVTRTVHSVLWKQRARKSKRNCKRSHISNERGSNAQRIGDELRVSQKVDIFISKQAENISGWYLKCWDSRPSAQTNIHLLNSNWNEYHFTIKPIKMNNGWHYQVQFRWSKNQPTRNSSGAYCLESRWNILNGHTP